MQPQSNHDRGCNPNTGTDPNPIPNHDPNP